MCVSRKDARKTFAAMDAIMKPQLPCSSNPSFYLWDISLQEVHKTRRHRRATIARPEFIDKLFPFSARRLKVLDEDGKTTDDYIS
jgi:hypothetical protein